MRKVVFGINITADGYCSHEDGIRNNELQINILQRCCGRQTLFSMVEKHINLWCLIGLILRRINQRMRASNEFARI